MHASVSDRARFPVIFELYSTRFGTATPNPDLGPERATNLELGWKSRCDRQPAPRGRGLLQRRPGPDSDGRAARHDDADAERRRRRSSTASRCRSTRRTARLASELSAATTPPSTATIPMRCSRTCGRPVCRRTRRSCTPRGCRSHASRSRPASTWLAIGGATSTRHRPSPTCAPALLAVRPGGAVPLLRRRRRGGSAPAEPDRRHYELAWGFPQPGRTFYVKTRIGL